MEQSFSPQLQVFGALYRYNRLDLPTLHHAAGVAWPKQTLRRRLNDLQRQSFIHVFYGVNGRPPVFALLDKGIQAYAAATNRPIHRTTQPAHDNAEAIRKHDVGLAKYLYARDCFLSAQARHFVLRHRDLCHQSLNDEVRHTHRLPVTFEYQNETYTHHLKPDDMTVVGGEGKRDLRLTVTEFDASTETRAPKKFRLLPANIFAKLVVYCALLEQGKFEEYLGLDADMIEFVTLTAARRDGIARLIDQVVPPEFQDRFRVAAAPDCPIENSCAYEQMLWSSPKQAPLLVV